MAATSPASSPVPAEVRPADARPPAAVSPPEQPDGAALHPVALYAHIGIATPYGGAGLSLDVVPVPWLGLEAGVGTNFDDPEFAFMPRLRFAPGKNKTMHLTLGAGVSYLPRYYAHQYNGLAGGLRIFEGMAEGTIQLTVWEPAYFANFELGGELRRGHFASRFYLGFTHLINAGDSGCTPGYYACNPSDGTNLVYLGGSFGYAF